VKYASPVVASTVPVLDILHDEPWLGFDAPSLHEVITFAFATGGGADAFTRVLERVIPAPSHYSGDCFVRDLFLEDFVARCLPVERTRGGVAPTPVAIRRLLAAPPADRNSTLMRQGVTRELLADASLRVQCRAAWERIGELRIALESAEFGKRSDPMGRRLELLRMFRSVVEGLPDSFAGTQSALQRVALWSTTVRESAGFQRMCQLLDYEDQRGILELRVAVGRDGSLKSLDIVAAREGAVDPMNRGPVARWWSRLVNLLSGYSVREREVLGRLVETVFEGIQSALTSLLQLGLHLEFYLAGLGLVQLARGAGLDVCLPTWSSADSPVACEVDGLFNPFLLHEATPPIPCQLRLGARGTLMLTGPNSGGKTRLLQSLGVLQLLAQSGLAVPAKQAVLPWRDGLFVSLVHEVSSDQKEGRLGTELMRIRRLFERIGVGHLVLVDELCSGTNPSEGEEIVELVISLLGRLQPLAVVSTHFLQFAMRLHAHPPVSDLSFLQVQLDDHQRPTFRFEPGVASTSLASVTAERLGVTRAALEDLIEKRLHQVN